MEFEVLLRGSEENGVRFYEIIFWTDGGTDAKMRAPNHYGAYVISHIKSTECGTKIGLRVPMGEDIASGITRCVSQLNNTDEDYLFDNYVELMDTRIHKVLDGIVLEITDNKRDITYRTMPIPFSAFTHIGYLSAYIDEFGRIRLGDHRHSYIT